MHRQELLSLARQAKWTRYWGALPMAERMTTPDAVKIETASLKKQLERASLWRGRTAIAFCASLGAILLLLFTASILDATNHAAILQRHEYPIGALALTLILALVASLVSCMVYPEVYYSIEEQLDLLCPVIASGECHKALTYVEAGAPAVLAWRDLAIAEREILYVFDVGIMHALHTKSEEDKEAAQRQQANEEACRKLYGVAA